MTNREQRYQKRKRCSLSEIPSLSQPIEWSLPLSLPPGSEKSCELEIRGTGIPFVPFVPFDAEKFYISHFEIPFRVRFAVKFKRSYEETNTTWRNDEP
jgi:hypothetical protein